LYVAKTDHNHVIAMTLHRSLTHRQRTDRQQGEAANITGTGELHDSTNGVGVNQDSENEVPWIPTTCLQLDQDDQDAQHDQVT
jgi:hypothetical protein